MLVWDAHDQAKVAKEKLRHLLNRPPWGRGVGVGTGSDGKPVIVVLINEISDEIRQIVPEEFEGFPVRIEAIGDIYAAPSR